MYVHRVNYRDGEPPKRFAVNRAVFAHWGPDKNQHQAHVEIAVRQMAWTWGAKVRLDGPYAETPIDAALYLGPVAVYAGTSLGVRLCRWLRMPDHGSREISVEAQGSDRGAGEHWAATRWVLRWALWTDPEHAVMLGGEKRGASWWYRIRRGYTHPIGAVVDLALGKVKYSTDTLASVDAVGWLPEGGYPLHLKLTRATWKRPRSPKAVVRRDVDWEVVPQSEGGPGMAQTGRIKWGSDDGICAASTPPLTARQAHYPNQWIPAALGSFTTQVLRDRARYSAVDWTPTGPIPGLIVREDDALDPEVHL